MIDIYDMKLFDYVIISRSTEVRRVPNGWVYIYKGEGICTSCFVPYHEEFKIIEGE